MIRKSPPSGLGVAVVAAVALVLFGSVGPVQADDVAAGEALFKQKCNLCHTTVPNKNMVGPSLFDVVGRQSGQAPGFHYSANNVNTKVVWTEKILDSYLTNPWDIIPGTEMTFRGLDDPAKRAEIIAFLKAKIPVDTPLSRSGN